MSEQLRKQWKVYHATNPHIYDAYEKYALEMSKHRKTYSSRGIIERLRWDTAISAIDDDYKIGNNHSTYYARLFMERHPHLKTFFRTMDLGIIGSVLS